MRSYKVSTNMDGCLFTQMTMSANDMEHLIMT